MLRRFSRTSSAVVGSPKGDLPAALADGDLREDKDGRSASPHRSLFRRSSVGAVPPSQQSISFTAKARRVPKGLVSPSLNHTPVASVSSPPAQAARRQSLSLHQKGQTVTPTSLSATPSTRRSDSIRRASVSSETGGKRSPSKTTFKEPFEDIHSSGRSPINPSSPTPQRLPAKESLTRQGSIYGADTPGVIGDLRFGPGWNGPTRKVPYTSKRSISADPSIPTTGSGSFAPKPASPSEQNPVMECQLKEHLHEMLKANDCGEGVATEAVGPVRPRRRSVAASSPKPNPEETRPPLVPGRKPLEAFTISEILDKVLAELVNRSGSGVLVTSNFRELPIRKQWARIVRSDEFWMGAQLDALNLTRNEFANRIVRLSERAAGDPDGINQLPINPSGQILVKALPLYKEEVAVLKPLLYFVGCPIAG